MEKEYTPVDIENASERRRRNLLNNAVDYLAGIMVLGIIFSAWMYSDKINNFVFTTMLCIVLIGWAAYAWTGKFTKQTAPVKNQSFGTDTSKLKVDENPPHNQWGVMFLFLLCFAIYIGSTGTLTYLAIHRLFNIQSFVGRTIFDTAGVLLNIWFAVPWISGSFDDTIGIKGVKKIAQLTINGNLVSWGKNLRPASWWRFCKILPLDWPKIELVPYDEEIKLTMQTNTGTEDGQQFNIKTAPEKDLADEEAEKTKDRPGIVKWSLESVINDTLLYASFIQTEERIHTIVFKLIETCINKNEKRTVQELDAAKNAIAKQVWPELEKRFAQIGLKLLVFDINAIERPSDEEKAEVEGRVLETLATRKAKANAIEATGLRQSAELIYEFIDGDPDKARAMELAFISAQQTQAISLQNTGGGAILPTNLGGGRDGSGHKKKGKGAGKSNPSPAPQPAVLPRNSIIADLLERHGHHGHHDQGDYSDTDAGD